MLELTSVDLEEIANALADQTDYEHRWLINPQTGEVVFWTVEGGIDGQTPVDLDELDLTGIDPLPSWIWYQDMADFAEAITDERAGRRLARAIQGKGAFRRFKDELHEEYPDLLPAWYAFRGARAIRGAVQWLAELIEAAARLVEASGDAHALTLAAVAREAGIAAPSIYRHFPGCDELAEALVADRFQRLDDSLLEAMSGTGDPAAALRACCDAYCRFGLEHPGHYRLLFSASLGPDPDRPGDRPGERVFARLVDAIQACIDAGAARQGDAHLMAVNVWVALHGIVSLRTSRPHHPWPPVGTLVNAALSGQVRLDRPT